MKNVVLRTFWQHIRRYKLSAFLILLGVVGAQVMEVVAPLYFKKFFDVLASDTGEKDAEALVAILVVIIFVRLIGWCFSQLFLFVNNYFQPRIMVDLERTSLRYLMGHSYQFFSNTFSGSLVRRVNRLSRSFEVVADTIMFDFLPFAVIAVGNLLVLYSRAPILAIAVFVWVVVIISFNVGFSKWKWKYDIKKAEADSKATGVLADIITNSINVKLFSGEAEENRRFSRITESVRRLRTFSWNLGVTMDAIQALLMIAIEFIAMYLAVVLWQQGVLTVGDFALIQAYLVGFFIRVWVIGKHIHRLYEALADAEEMVEILETPHEVKDGKGAKTLVVKKGRIQFKDVVFGFSKRPVLRKLNLTIRAGEKVALVGPSGAGKSTITKLLFRFYDAKQGKILIDGQEVKKVTQDSLRENISLVPQEPILFHRTLMENIRYGRRDATDEEVMEAARQAHCDQFIANLKHGYETFVGERGIKLSGGERQRVAIARAILKNAPILVLDEATSSLDSESESLIQDALARLMKGKTTIVIAHRLSTIMQMDRIIVISDGQVTDQGTHAALLKKKTGIYKKLWDIQAGGFISDV